MSKMMPDFTKVEIEESPELTDTIAATTIFGEALLWDIICELRDELLALSDSLRWRDFNLERPEAGSEVLIYSNTPAHPGRHMYVGTIAVGDGYDHESHWRPLPEAPLEYR